MPGIVARHSRKVYPPTPSGVHSAVCVDIVDLGETKTPWGDKHQVELRWQVDKPRDDGKRHLVVRRFTLSLSGKSNLRPFLEGWFGRELTSGEVEDGIDLEEALLGLPCLLQVLHQTSTKGEVWAFANAALPLPDGIQGLGPQDYIRKINRDPGPGEPSEEEMPF